MGLASSPMPEPDLSKRLGRSCPALVEPYARVEQPVGDIVEGGLVFGQEELLEHEPDPGGPQRRQLPVRKLGDIEAGHPNRSTARAVEGADEMQQRRLARPRRSDDGGQLTLVDGKADPA